MGVLIFIVLRPHKGANKHGWIKCHITEPTDFYFQPLLKINDFCLVLQFQNTILTAYLSCKAKTFHFYNPFPRHFLVFRITKTELKIGIFIELLRFRHTAGSCR